MLAELSTLKVRLALDEFDVKYDALLLNAIRAITTRFDRECNRSFARTVDAVHECNADTTEIRVACYPIESVAKFDVKANESEGWVERTNVEYLVRTQCVISLTHRLGSRAEQARLTYTGGYVLPGLSPAAGQSALPADLEQAAIEQLTYWFQNRDKLGLLRIWPHQGTYQQFAPLDLLPGVVAVLKRYERWPG